MIPRGYETYNVCRVVKENVKTQTLILDKAIPAAQPGQFVMVWLPEVGEKPFSIADNDPFSLTIAAVGPVSEALCALKPGERLWARGPLGHGFKLSGRRHLLIGGGYGAAPLLYLANEAVSRGDAVCVCLGASRAEELLLEDAFREAGCEVLVATDDGSRGQKGLVTKIARSVIKDWKPDTLYACGPGPMLVAVADLCAGKGLPVQLSWEAIMRCGVGLCGACELDKNIRQKVGIMDGWLTCKDGPVSIHRFGE